MWYYLDAKYVSSLLHLFSCQGYLTIIHSVLQLTYQGREIPDQATDMCPWLDFRQPPIEVQNELMDATTERRQIKTHLRLDALKFNPKAKYIYLARDGRDTYISFCNHYKNQNNMLYEIINHSPGEKILLLIVYSYDYCFFLFLEGLVGAPCPTWQEKGYTEATWFDDWISKGW